MALKVGIVGLPNVGKSTLFSALTNNSTIEIQNYPFTTIEPNVGVVKVADSRLDFLEATFASDKKTYTNIKFVDIAGLIKGASTGEGLGNLFLANIRDTDLIAMVVRCFDDKKVIHVSENIDPISDLEIINIELILSDQKLVEKAIAKIKKRAHATNDKTLLQELNGLEKLLQLLKDDVLLSSCELSAEELNRCDRLNLLTHKPLLIVANIAETDLKNPMLNQNYKKLSQYCHKYYWPILPLCIKMEESLIDASPEDRKWILSEYNLQESALQVFIQKCYEILNLKTFFTAGKQEVRAWTFHNGWAAPQCAGQIHTDFQNKFIAAEIYRFEDLVKYHTETAIKKAGLMRSEGKKYLMADGDICFFKFGK